MNRFRNWKTSLFVRLILAYAIIIVVLVVSIVTIFIAYNGRDYRKDLTQDSRLILQRFKNDVDTYILQEVDNFIVNYISLDNELNRLFFIPLGNNLHYIDGIYNKLQSYLHTSSLFHSIYIYYMNNDLVVSNTGAYILRHNEYANNSIDWLIKRNFTSPITWLNMPSFKNHYLIDDRNSADVVSIVRRYPFAATSDSATGYIAINIKVDEIYKQSLNLSGSTFGDLLILNEDGEILGKSITNLTLSSDQIQLGDADSDDLSTIYIDGKRMWACVEKSSVNDWKYVYIVSQDLFAERIRVLLGMGFSIALLTIIVPIVIAFMLTKRIYNPINVLIKRSMELNRKIFGQSSTTHTNEEEIGKTIDNLVTKVGTLQNQISSFEPEIKSILMGRLLLKEDGVVSHNVDKELKQMGIQFPYKNFWCLFTQVKEPEKFDSAVLYTNTHNLCYFIENIDMNKCVRLSTNLLDSNSVLTLVNAESLQEVDFLAHSIKEYAQRFGCPVVVGIGYNCEDLFELRDSYETAKSAVKYSFIYYEQDIFNAAKTTKLDASSERVDREIIEEFEKSLYEDEGAHALSILEDIFQKLIKKELSYTYIQKEINTLYDMLREKIRLVSQDAAICEIEMKNIFDVYDTLGKICEMYFEIKRKLRERKAIEEVERIKNYIYDKIVSFETEDLSLGEIARRFGKNSNYLSNMFKDAGMNFKDYVLETKLAIAKEELKKDNVKIGDLANKLGYYNVSYFIRIFKNQIGCTPRQYQRVHCLEK